MNIDSLGAQQIKDLLPYGGLRQVQKRLKERGISYSYVTVQKFENQAVIEEAVSLLHELADQNKKQVLKRKELVKKLGTIV